MVNKQRKIISHKIQMPNADNIQLTATLYGELLLLYIYGKAM